MNNTREALNYVIKVVVEGPADVSKSAPNATSKEGPSEAGVDGNEGHIEDGSVLVDKDREGGVDADVGGRVRRGLAARGGVEVDVDVGSKGGVGHQGDGVVVDIILQPVEVDEDTPEN